MQADEFIKNQQQINRLVADNARLKNDLQKERHYKQWFAHFFRGLSPRKALPMLEG